MRSITLLPACCCLLLACPAAQPMATDGPVSPDLGVSSDVSLPPDASAPPGTVIWSTRHGLQVAYGPALDQDGRLYLQGNRPLGSPATLPTLVVLNPDGTAAWSADTSPASVPAPPVALGNDLVLAPATFATGGDLSGKLYRFGADGRQESALPLDGPVGDGLAIDAQGLIVVPSTSLIAFRGEVEQWRFPMSGDGKTGTNAVIGPSGTIYVAGRGADHQLYAIKADGTERWRFDLRAPTINAIAVDRDERIYTRNGDGLLRVIGADGVLVWSYPTIDGGSGFVVDENGVVYFGVISLDPNATKLFAVKQGTGIDGFGLWQTELGFLVKQTPALSGGGTLYVGDSCKTLFALRAADGGILWRFVPPNTPEDKCAGGWSSPSIGPDGTVYASVTGAPGEAGTLYAFAGDGSPLSQAAPWPGEQGDLAHQGRRD